MFVNFSMPDLEQHNYRILVLGTPGSGKSTLARKLSISLKSFRHHYGIRRVYETNGNIFQVAREMGHTDTKTTHHYLQFQPDEIRQYLPSLIPIIEKMENMQKNSIRGTKMRETIYSSVNKLSI